MNKNRFRFYILLSLLSSVLLLGAKGCDANTRSDIIANLPELNSIADKFEIEETENSIILTTKDSLTFQEAVNTLKNKTEMNNPISFYGTVWGVYKSEIYAFEKMDPYRGIIYILGGWWRAIEYDAVSAVNSGDKDAIVYITEYAYCNDTVFEVNQFSQHGDVFYFMMSMLDSGDYEVRPIQGDGSVDNTIIMEFEK